MCPIIFNLFPLVFRWAMHEKVLKPLRKNAKHIHAWWEFTGRPDPGEEAILETLKRLVSGVLTHPVTIGEGRNEGIHGSRIGG